MVKVVEWGTVAWYFPGSMLRYVSTTLYVYYTYLQQLYLYHNKLEVRNIIINS